MKKLSLAAILAIGCMQNTHAQTADQAVAKDKMYDQYIGVQLNGLIRQVFNFNNSTTATGTAVNPYLLTYSINSKKTGWGLRAGIGYNYNSTTGSDDGGISTTVTKINDLQARLGVEKLFQLTGKWSAGAGLDLVYTTNNDHTTNTTNASGNDPGTVTDTKSVSSTYGGGPMGWLRYSVTKSVLIGTEASFYYVAGNSTNTISISDPTMSNPVLSAPVSSNGKVGQGNFTSPVVFFITVKF